MRERCECSLACLVDNILIADPVVADNVDRIQLEKTAPRTGTIVRTTTNSGVRVNQYTLGDVLGQGSFGTVYSGAVSHEGMPDRHVAVKVVSKLRLRKKLMAERSPLKTPRSSTVAALRSGLNPSEVAMVVAHADQLACLWDEVDLLSTFSHPHIVSLLEVLENPVEDAVYIVFELLGGGPVMALSSAGRGVALTEEKAQLYFYQLTLAVAFLHERHIVHRDIKPANLVRAADLCVVKLIDFSTARLLAHSGELLAQFAGTPAFMAPEAMDPLAVVYRPAPCDLWAMGVTLFALLFGRIPFAGANNFLLFQNIRDVPHPTLRDMQPVATDTTGSHSVSDLAFDLVSGLLQKDPGRRTTLAGVFNHAWITRPVGVLPPSMPTDAANIIGVTAAFLPNAQPLRSPISSGLHARGSAGLPRGAQRVASHRRRTVMVTDV